ncbi:hypothetical protein [Sorangium sp. So ce128]|uniref:hypothetical protein n=1 Tax=Sorangium sp. So ce128 TaxID=3133281 RepID=UPI003F6272B4
MIFPLVSLHLVTASATSAQPLAAPRAAAPAPADPAADALRRAHAARSAGRWQEAEAAYRAAFAAAPRPAIEGELGLCELALRRPVDAANHLLRALRDSRALTPAEQRRFNEGLRRAEKDAIHVEIMVSHDEAEIFVDGRFIGRGQANYQFYVTPGAHEVRGSLEGHVTQTVRFENYAGDGTILPLVLDPILKAPPPEVIIRTTPPAPDHSGRNIRIAGASLALAGAAFGAGFAIAAGVRDDEADAQADAIRRDYGRGGCLYKQATEVTLPCKALEETLSARDTLRGAAWASFIAGGIFGAVAISSLWWAPSPPSPARVAVRPLVAAGGGGVAIAGVW